MFEHLEAPSLGTVTGAQPVRRGALGPCGAPLEAGAALAAVRADVRPLRKRAAPPPSLDKNAPSHPQHLLRLACNVLRADLGGIGLLSAEGKLVEHITFGVTDEVAAGMWQSPWLTGLI